MIQTHMFWAYGNISNLEKICINSFIKQGYDVNLWTYGDLTNAPAGANIKDARRVLPEKRVFLWRNQSYACFSDLFRYAVLTMFGGLYADTDVVALIPPNIFPLRSFLVTERAQTPCRALLRSSANYLFGRKRPRINNNLIFNAAPTPGDIIDLAYAFSDRFPIEKMGWGDIGPNLLSVLANEYPAIAFEIKEPNFSNSIDWWDCPKKLLKPKASLSKKAAFIHCYSGMWGSAGIDKNSSFPKDSLMASFADRYI